MLIDFRQLWPKYNIKPKGVLHIGGNVGEEAPVYLELGVTKQLWVEGNTEIFRKLCENIKHNPDAFAANMIISEKSESVKFNISNNDSQSSSILEFGTHSDVHPNVVFVKSEQRRATTIRNLYHFLQFQGWFNESDYDFLNIDLQCAEMKALRGMMEIINNFKWIYTEVNKAELYIGCPLVEVIDKYVALFNFERVETYWAGNTGWGDALYCKKDLA